MRLLLLPRLACAAAKTCDAEAGGPRSRALELADAGAAAVVVAASTNARKLALHARVQRPSQRTASWRWTQRPNDPIEKAASVQRRQASDSMLLQTVWRMMHSRLRLHWEQCCCCFRHRRPGAGRKLTSPAAELRELRAVTGGSTTR